jgi:hypothetical protein
MYTENFFTQGRELGRVEEERRGEGQEGRVQITDQYKSPAFKL